MFCMFAWSNFSIGEIGLVVDTLFFVHMYVGDVFHAHSDLRMMVLCMDLVVLFRGLRRHTHQHRQFQPPFCQRRCFMSLFQCQFIFFFFVDATQ